MSYLKERSRVTYNCLLPKILRLRQCCNHPDAMLGHDDYQVESNRYIKKDSVKFTKVVQLIKNCTI